MPLRRFGLTPQARAHFRYRDLLKSFFPCDWSGAWREFFSTEQVYGFGSGRAAFAQLLIALKQQSQRSDVILPAYTCPSVTESIRYAGLNPVHCDMASDACTVDSNRLSKLVNMRTLAIVTTNLYGVADPVCDMRMIASQKGAFLIEDLSLSLGSRIGGKLLGTFGNAAFFSLGMSKLITTAGGGILTVRDEGIDTTRLDERRWINSFIHPKQLTMLFLYPILLSKIVFRIIDALSSWRECSPAAVVSEDQWPWSMQQARLSGRLLESLKGDLARRSQNGQQIWKLVEASPYNNLALPPGVQPCFARFPFLADSLENRVGLIDRFRRWGVRATTGFDEVQTYLDPTDHPHAIDLCRRLITLPSHARLDDRSVDAMQTVLSMGKVR